MAYNMRLKLKLLEDFYRYVKKLSPQYYQDGMMIKEYQEIKRQILELENTFNNLYITDVNMPKKTVKDLKNEYFHKMLHYYFLDEEVILDYLVSQVQEKLLILSQKHFQIDIEDFNNLDLTNYCYDAALITKKVANNLGLEAEIKEIAAGFDYQADLFSGSGRHYFVFVKIKDKQFLVDLTYKQFFKVGKCSLERLGVPLLCAPQPGIFMLNNKERLMVAKKLLKDGYLWATIDNLKNYFDGFALSFRNGLYYENQGCVDYTTIYSKDDYFSFLETDDSQLKREKKLFLGPQLHPLTNPKFKFKK